MTSRRDFFRTTFAALVASISLPKLQQQSEDPAWPFLLFDEFRTGDLSALRTCDGAGTLRVIDTTGRLSLGANGLHANGTQGRGDPLLYDPTPYPRVPGLALMAAHRSHQYRMSASGSDIRYGFHHVNPESINPNYLVWIEMHETAGHCVGASGLVPFSSPTQLGIEYKYALIIGDPYVYFARSMCDCGVWVLTPPVSGQFASTLYALRGSDRGTDTWQSDTRFMKVINLAEQGYNEWAQPYGPYSLLMQNVPEGTVFQHPARGTITLELVRSGNAVFRFRQQDLLNYYELRVRGDSTLMELIRVVKGKPTNLGYTGARLDPSGISTISISLDGDEVRVVEGNGTHHINTGSPNGEDATGFEVVSLGGCVLRSVATYERYHSFGVVAESLNAMERARCLSS